MKSVVTKIFGGQNITTIKVALSLIGLAISLISLQNYNNFAFSQIGGETSQFLNSNNLTTPGSDGSNQSLGGSQSQPLPGFVTKGKINTLISVPTGKWLASGNWSIILNNGNVTSFGSNMTWYNSSGTNAHTHELTNFKTGPGGIQTLPLGESAEQIIIKGVSDVGANNRISWFEVPTTITINDHKIVSISLDDNKTNHHFGGQPLLGIVDSFVQCSDTPGPNMELLPPCSISPTVEEGFGLTNESSSFTPSEGALTGGGMPPGGIPPGEEQTGGGGIPPGGIPPGGIPGGIPSGEQQSGGGGIPSGEQQSGGGGIPSGEQQSGGGGIPPRDEKAGTPEMNPQCTDLKIDNITANGFETDPSDRHPPSDAIDGSSSTWWSYNGKNPWVEIRLKQPEFICGLSVLWNKGDVRKYSFEIGVSEDGNKYEKAFEGSNKKGTSRQEIYPFEEGIGGKFVRLTITNTSSKDGWASVQEMSALGLPSGYNQTGGGGIPPGGIPPVDNQTGGGGIPPGGIPPVDNQTGGGGILPIINQTRQSS
jgi:F5/8 type C domain